MPAVITLLLVLVLSLVVIRIATVGLTMTGLSRDLAQFQALSAFTGSGFTTREAEQIVNHPVRRRIVMHLMLLGNAGIVTAIPLVLLSFLNLHPGETSSLGIPESTTWTDTWWFRVEILAGGVLLLWLLASSRYVERLMWRVNTWALRRWTGIDVQDYTGLLRVARDYSVSELLVHEDDWLSGHTLLELQLASEGILVLGVERADGQYIGAPRGQTRIEANDRLILYGRQPTLMSLHARRSGMEGNLQHVISVTRQVDIAEAEGTSVENEGSESSDGGSSAD